METQLWFRALGIGNSQLLVIKDQNYEEGTREDVGRISDAVLTELAGYKISFVQQMKQ